MQFSVNGFITKSLQKDVLFTKVYQKKFWTVEGDGEVVDLDVPGHGMDSQHSSAGSGLGSEPKHED